MKRLLIYIIYASAVLTIAAQNANDTVRTSKPVEHTHLFGIGTNNVLDTYLSPLEYSGLSLSYEYTTRRALSRKAPQWDITAVYGLNASHLDSPTEDAKEWDGNLHIGAGVERRWKLGRRWTVSAGPMAEVNAGFTYNTRNGNNPAQGRFSAALGLMASARYDFSLLRRNWTAAARMEMPVAGCMFSPEYGQSYYEMFSLGHGGSNVVGTWAGNAPTLRLRMGLAVPVSRRSRLVVGYRADIVQSKVNNIKTHHWSHQFMLGYTRTLRLE